MAKRLFSSDKRSEAILNRIKSENSNISAYISSAVINGMLPCYGSLYVEALYLLDMVIDGAKDWSGNRLVIMGSNQRDEIIYTMKQALDRTIMWLRDGHRIKDPGVLKYMLSFYDSGIVETDEFTELSDAIKDSVFAMADKIKAIDPDYLGMPFGLASISRDILDHWDSLWDDRDAYEVLFSLTYYYTPRKTIDPYNVIHFMKAVELQYIKECMRN